MNTATIVIGGVGKKREGLTSDRRPWSLWGIHSDAGLEYTTFDGVIAHRALEAVGCTARIEYEQESHGSRKLTSLKVERSEAA